MTSRKGQFFLLGFNTYRSHPQGGIQHDKTQWIPTSENLAHIKPYFGGCIPLT